MIAFASQGISLGFSAGTLPGPLQAYLINTTLAHGWRKSLVIIFAPLVVDIPFILLAVFALREFPDWFLDALRIGGGLLLYWIAYGAWRRWRAGEGIAPQDEAGEAAGLLNLSLRAIFTRALLLNFISPGPYLFWSTVNGPLLVEALEQSVGHGLAFLLGFYGTFLGMMALVIGLFTLLRRIDPRVTRWVLLLTIILLVIIGTQLILQGVAA
jgi:threonine/homoserine/homoserine lactone efflux protein